MSEVGGRGSEVGDRGSWIGFSHSHTQLSTLTVNYEL